MKAPKVFAALIVACVLFVGLRMALAPRDFEWFESFSHTDDQPWGCLVFDSLMAASMGDRYAVADTTIAALWQDSLRGPQGLLLVDPQWVDSVTLSQLISMARRGDRIIIARRYLGQLAQDSLGINCHTHIASYPPKPKAAEHSTFVYTGDSLTFPPLRTELYSIFCRATMAIDSTGYPHEVLLSVIDPDDDRRLPLAVSFPIGQGELVFTTSPQLFSNFSILNDASRQLAFRLMAHLGPLPVTRLDPLLDYAPAADADQLDYILSQPPLAMAFWLTIIAVLAFMLTAARRRQRVIPVISEPQNHALEFVRLIGTLYYEEGNAADLVFKKFQYSSERLRRQLRGDTERAALLHGQLEHVWQEARQYSQLSPEQLRDYIDRIDRIMKQATST